MQSSTAERVSPCEGCTRRLRRTDCPTCTKHSPQANPCKFCVGASDVTMCVDCEGHSNLLPVKLEPYPHQLEDYLRFKDDPAFALFWEMGTGKTKETLDIAAYKYLKRIIDKVIIVAPNTVHEQWVGQEIPKHCAVPYSTFVYYNKDTDKFKNALFEFIVNSDNKDKLHFLAIHTDAFKYPKIGSTIKRFVAGANVLWVVDEATRIKNEETKVHSNLLQYKQRYGGCCTALTGTALAKRPFDAYGIVEYVRPGYMGMSSTAFKHRHAVMMKHTIEYERGGSLRTMEKDVVLLEGVFWKVKRTISSMLIESMRVDLSWEQVHELSRKFSISEADIKFIDNSPQFTRYKNIESLKTHLMPMSSMRRKVDCVNLPDKVYQEIQFDLSPEQKRVIAQMKDYAVAQYGDKELTIAQKQNLQTRALQVCGGFFPYLKDMDLNSYKYGTERMKETNAKLEYIKNDIEELGGEPFIVWAVYTDEIQLLFSELNKLVPMGALYGGVPMEQRRAYTQQFLSGEVQGIVANPSVGGYGLNFQHAGYQYWYSRNYRTEDRLQAEDRSHRIGIVRSPVYKDLVYRCAFERKVLADNKEGREMNDYFNSASVAELFSI